MKKRVRMCRLDGKCRSVEMLSLLRLSSLHQSESLVESLDKAFVRHVVREEGSGGFAPADQAEPDQSGSDERQRRWLRSVDDGSLAEDGHAVEASAATGQE